MNKIKDFIYDKNDLLVALLIVAAAAFLIMSRINVIMDYPVSLAAQAQLPGGQVVAEVPDDPADLPGEENPATEGQEPADSVEDPGQGAQEPVNSDGTNAGVGEQTTGEPTTSQVSIYIEYGANGSDIAQLLIDSGLIDSKQVFYDAVTAAGADTKLQAGSFKIPSNATPAQIIQIITN